MCISKGSALYKFNTMSEQVIMFVMQTPLIVSFKKVVVEWM